jgi:GNAT superfamily N-acetyltransferase
MNIENCTQEDFLQIRDDVVEFWGSDRTLHLHHPIFLREFGDTAYVIREGTRVLAYLFGFIAQKHPVGYVHLVAVREPLKGQGLGKCLYEHFAQIAAVRGCNALKAITSPGNEVSIAFHKALGFELEGLPNADGVPVVRDYAGKGNDLVVFRKSISGKDKAVR